jgi:hypothetical protein
VTPQAWSALMIQVKKGSYGDAVRGVQEEFRFRSGEPGKGWNRRTVSLDIPSDIVDGIVGPVTWQALVSGMLSG